MLNMRVFGRKLASFTLVALFLGTSLVAATEQTTVIQGHVNWTYISGYDPCMAAVAGLASSRVLWFDDSVLVDNFNFGNTWIYAAQAGAPDPRGKSLAYVRSFEFDDPNGQMWNVSEYQYYGDPVSGESPAGVSTHGTDADPGVSNSDREITARERVRAGPYYTWVVRLLETPRHDQYPGNDPHEKYNFVLLVDTCKFFTAPSGTEQHYKHDGDEHAECPPHPQVCVHEHEEFLADLLLGGAPDDRGILIDTESEIDYHQSDRGGQGGSADTPYTP